MIQDIPPLRDAIQLQALGYVGVRTKDLEEWAIYATRFLGMQLVDKSRDTLALRMDDRKQRVIVSAADGEGLGGHRLDEDGEGAGGDGEAAFAAGRGEGDVA